MLRKLEARSDLRRVELHRFGWILRDIQDNRDRVTNILRGMLPILIQKDFNPKDVKSELKRLAKYRMISREQFDSLMLNADKINIDDFVLEIKSLKSGRGMRFLPTNLDESTEAIPTEPTEAIPRSNSIEENDMIDENDEFDEKDTIDDDESVNHGMSNVDRFVNFKRKHLPSFVDSIINGTSKDILNTPPAKISCFNPSISESQKSSEPKKDMNSGHILSKIPPTERKKWAQKPCVLCRKYGVRNDTRYICILCNAALCKVPCFSEYHCTM